LNVVFLLNSTFPHYSGGRETWLARVSWLLAERGHQVVILVIRPERFQDARHVLHPAIRLVQVQEPNWLRLCARFLRGPLRELHSLLTAWPIRGRLRQLLRDSEKSVVVTLDTVVLPLCVPMRAAGTRPWICASKGPHAAIMGQSCPPLRPLFNFLERRAFAQATEIWSNGRDMEKSINDSGFSNVFIGNGVDTNAWAAEVHAPPEYANLSRERRVVSIGSVLPIKGVESAVRALAYRVQPPVDFQPWRLTWIGKGDPLRYRSLAEALGVAEAVDFLGDRDDVRPYAKYADALLCLSGGGGMSMSALESLCSGAPVIAWDSPVYRQLIEDGKSGFLVRQGDERALAMTIQTVLRLSPTHRRLIAARARSAVRKHDWNAVVSRIEERLERLST
jgi:glycosyltransferase involved in cell wall biosynthesis